MTTEHVRPRPTRRAPSSRSPAGAGAPGGRRRGRGVKLLAGIPALLLATVLGLASPAPLAGQDRIGPGNPVTSDLPGAWALNPGLLEVVDHREENVLELRLGPVYLPGGMPHMRAPVQLMEVPFDGYLHGFSWAVVDASGDTLRDSFLHHLNLIDLDHRELFAPLARRVLAAGRETKKQEVPQILGYPFEKGTRWALVGMFANRTRRDHPRAYLELKIRYSREGEHLVEPRTVYPFYTDVMGAVGSKDFPVPPGRTVKSWTGSPAVDARILGLGGHLHDYGKALRLEDAETGEVLWRVEPETRGEHHVTRVPASKLWMKGGIKLEAEKEYTISAVYRNPTDRPSPHGGMGVVAGIVLADPADWPEFDRTADVYVEDTYNTLTAPARADAYGHGGADGGWFHGGTGGHSHAGDGGG